MISQAVVGHLAAAAAWSTNEEERRKALFAYLETGLPLLIWDNIKRGSVVSCPSIEKALTTETYSDRVLGMSEIRQVPANTIQAFTGNNVHPGGDLSSRSLKIQLDTDRPDPENRTFAHSDPISWTLNHRGRLLQAMYTILLGNPRRQSGRHTEPETRFKVWWDIIGSAVEYAAGLASEYADGLVIDALPTCPPRRIRFKEMFLRNEDDDEQTVGSAAVLSTLMDKFMFEWFQGADVSRFMAEATDAALALKINLEVATSRLIPIVSAPVMTARLKIISGAPILIGSQVLILRYEPPNPGRRDGGFKITPVNTR
jgi:hypothetical protein